MSHAIVMGGSIAGLCAAAALVKRFDRVTVLERDPEPTTEHRRGTPQAHHVHALMSRGQRIMDSLFPGVFAALAEEGAVCLEMGNSFHWFGFGSWKTRADIGVVGWFQSRPLLEHHLRQNLKRNPRVDLRSGVAVDEPIHTHGRVTGVRLRGGEEQRATLVVDATGRGSRSATWLEEWGYGRVAEQRVHLGLAYVSGVFESRSGAAADRAFAVYQHAQLGNKRLGYCFPLERDRRVVTLAGYHGDHAPTDIAGFREWAKTLLQPAIADELADYELVGELHKFTYREQLRRCYGAMRALPEGYLIVGDAMCSFDPTFGQGMLIAAMQAEVLAERARPDTVAPRLQRRLYATTTLPFTLAANEGHRWAETAGWKPAFSRLQQRFLGKVFDAASEDPTVYRALMRVMHVLAPPTSLVHPKILWRVLTSRHPPYTADPPRSSPGCAPEGSATASA